ncbi:MAG: hypothetical protein AB1705_24095 [Verrucomicrobiota bacterium]
MNAQPVPVINRWSDSLACVSWFLARHGKPQSQEEIIHQFGLWFPQWVHRPGFMDRGDLINLLARWGFPARRFVHLNEQTEALRLVTHYYSDYLAGFAFTRKPTTRCLAVDTWNNETVVVMDPHPNAPAMHTLKWADLFQQYDADVMWLFR